MVGNTVLSRTKMCEVRYGNLTLMLTILRFQTVGGPWAVCSRVSARVSYQRNWYRNRNLKVTGITRRWCLHNCWWEESNGGRYWMQVSQVFCSELRLDFP